MSRVLPVSRTIVYIDGFNLYYRALKGTASKWLNVEALSRAALPKTLQVIGVNYYTAHVSGRVDPGAPKRDLGTRPRAHDDALGAHRLRAPRDQGAHGARRERRESRRGSGLNRGLKRLKNREPSLESSQPIWTADFRTSLTACCRTATLTAP